MSQEPEYLKRLRAQQERQGKAAKSASPDRPETGAPQYTAQEHEALRWARELAESTELRSVRNLSGARFAVLVRLQSASGLRFLSVEGIPTGTPSRNGSSRAPPWAKRCWVPTRCAEGGR